MVCACVAGEVCFGAYAKIVVESAIEFFVFLFGYQLRLHNWKLSLLDGHVSLWALLVQVQIEKLVKAFVQAREYETSEQIVQGFPTGRLSYKV